MKTNLSFYKIQNRVAISDGVNDPDFMDIKNGIFLSSNCGKSTCVLYFEDGILKYKTREGVVNINNGLNLQLQNENDSILIGNNVGDGLTEGDDLIAIGSNTLADSSAIGNSIAIGAGSMSKCGKTELNIAIGKDTLSLIQDSHNIAIGIEACKELDGKLSNHNISIGTENMKYAGESIMEIISIGSNGCSNITGNNFKSIYIGNNVAKNLESDVISVNNVGIGSETLLNAKNISDLICIGALSGQNVNGIRSILLGSKAGNNIQGSLNDDILIGSNAGCLRKYTDSKNILIGSNVGVEGSGNEIISLGNLSASELIGNDNYNIGTRSGQHLVGNENICVGLNSGMSLTGSYNICVGTKTGYGLEGNRNVWIGYGPNISDILNDTVVIGSRIFVKGNEGVVIGSQVGKSSIGFLNRDILIGANAGMGQKYNEDLTENRGMILIGANAGFGNPSNPEMINSSDLVCLGQSAGHSTEQSFNKTVFIGNYAGSFAEISNECVAIGHSAGVGTSGESNIFIGAHAGFNVKGSKNILIGSHCGDQAGEIETQLNNVLAIGNSNRPVILGTLNDGNILIGSTKINQSQWTDGKGSIGFVSTEKPIKVSSEIGGVLYANGKHLEFATDKRITNITFPYKFISQGELNGLKYALNLDVDGGTLLSFKIVPSSKRNLVLSEEVLLTVSGKSYTLGKFTSQYWTLEISDNILTLKCIEDVKGICFIESIGIHVLKEIK